MTAYDIAHLALTPNSVQGFGSGESRGFRAIERNLVCACINVTQCPQGYVGPAVSEALTDQKAFFVFNDKAEAIDIVDAMHHQLHIARVSYRLASVPSGA